MDNITVSARFMLHQLQSAMTQKNISGDLKNGQEIRPSLAFHLSCNNNNTIAGDAKGLARGMN
jgi:hypothetical protein